MRRPYTRATTIAALLAFGANGCRSFVTREEPRSVAPAELTLVYDDGLQMRAGRTIVASGHEYDGLEAHVGCVPIARAHAEHARTDGRTGTALTIAGGTAGVASLGGVSGLAFVEDDPALAASLLLGGLALATTGVVLAAVGRSYKSRAHGHAIDAMNYYNDAVGSAGGSCAPGAR